MLTIKKILLTAFAFLMTPWIEDAFEEAGLVTETKTPAAPIDGLYM